MKLCRAKRPLSFALLTTCPLIMAAQGFQWVRSLGGGDYDQAMDIQADGSGNMWSTGYVIGPSTSDCSTVNGIGGADVSVIKLDAFGNCLLSFIDGGPQGDEVGQGIATDVNGNVYITGSYTSVANFGGTSIPTNGMADMFIVKYNTNGVQQWVAHGGGGFDDEGRAVSVDTAGNVFVCGYFRNTATFGAFSLASSGNRDAFLAKLDANGNFAWAVKAGGNGGEEALAVATDIAGNAFTTGYFSSAIASFGQASVATNGGADLFVAKYDPAGACLWVRNGGGITSDQGNDVVADALGNCYVTGWVVGDTVTFDGTVSITNGTFEDAVLARYDALGNLDWVITTGGADVDQGTGLALNTKNEPVLTGNFSGAGTFGGTLLSSSGGVDVFVAVYDTTGSGLWALAAGGLNYDPAGKVTVDAQDGVTINGGYDQQALFGAFPITSIASTDHYMARIGEIISGVDGTPQPEAVFSLLWDQNNGMLTITGTGSTGSGVPLTYRAFDSSGRLVLYGHAALPHAIDLSCYAPGLYTIRLNDATHTASGRIMKF
jgi:hypothetical protein